MTFDHVCSIDFSIQDDTQEGLGRGLVIKLRFRSGLAQVWFSLQLRLHSLELDSELVGLVPIYFLSCGNLCFVN